MPLTANTERAVPLDQYLKSYYVADGAHIFKGAFVGVDSAGKLVAYNPATTATFVGIAYMEYDNTSGQNPVALVQTQGDFKLPVLGVSAADVGAAVYALDDETLALEGVSDSYVGRVIQKTQENMAVVRLKSSPGDVI